MRGMSIPLGQWLRQYLQAVHGADFASTMFLASEMSPSISLPSSGLSSSQMAMFCLICSMLEEPERTTVTSGMDWRNLNAQATGASSGLIALRTAASGSARFARRPPRTGSITQHGMPMLLRSSILAFASWNSQST